ncbi:MAG: cell division ATP-binding protein FtsE [bacterium]
MIEMAGVYKTYARGVRALTDINMHVEKGEFVFIMGPSGAGKTTILKMIIRECLPSRGTVLVNGIDVAKLKRRQVPMLRRKIGYVFQDIKLLVDKTAFENIAFAQRVIGVPWGTEIQRRVTEALRLVGLSTKKNFYPAQLSDGEKQRVAIARAIVNNPLILLADEPTGNLDADISWEIMRLLKDINTRGTTVIMATHNREMVSRLNERIIYLKNGRIVGDGKGVP